MNPAAQLTIRPNQGATERLVGAVDLWVDVASKLPEDVRPYALYTFLEPRFAHYRAEHADLGAVQLRQRLGVALDRRDVDAMETLLTDGSRDRCDRGQIRADFRRRARIAVGQEEATALLSRLRAAHRRPGHDGPDTRTRPRGDGETLAGHLGETCLAAAPAFGSGQFIAPRKNQSRSLGRGTVRLNRYEARCTVCGRGVDPGAGVLGGGPGRWLVRHLGCQAPPPLVRNPPALTDRPRHRTVSKEDSRPVLWAGQPVPTLLPLREEPT